MSALKHLLWLISIIFLVSNCSNDNTTNPSSDDSNKDTVLNILNLVPANNALGVELRPQFEISFDKDISPVIGNIYLFEFSNDQLIQNLDIATEVEFQEKLIKFTINKTLSYGTKYYFILDSGAILFGDNYSFPGFQSKDVWTFTTKDKPTNQLTATISGSVNLNFVSDVGEINVLVHEYSGIKSITIGGIRNPKSDFYQLILSYDDDGSGKMEFDLSEPMIPSSFVDKVPQQDDYGYNVTGNLTLTENSEVAIVGTFNFKSSTKDGNKTVNITNGVVAYYQ
ncbi:Ig-like domain-containing protein [Bacteroidota bacterium]